MSVQKGLLIFFIIGIAVLLYGLWATTPRASQPGSCKFLEEGFCDKGHFIEENQVTYIAFEDLPNGTPLFSLINGERTTAQIPAGSSETSLQGSVLSTFPTDRSFNYIYIGDFKWSNNTEIKSGETVGTISNSGVKSLGKYELLITASKRNSSGTLESDKEALQKLFPRIK